MSVIILWATVYAEYRISFDSGIAGDRECLHSVFWFCEWQGVRNKKFRADSWHNLAGLTFEAAKVVDLPMLQH